MVATGLAFIIGWLLFSLVELGCMLSKPWGLAGEAPLGDLLVLVASVGGLAALAMMPMLGALLGSGKLERALLARGRHRLATLLLRLLLPSLLFLVLVMIATISVRKPGVTPIVLVGLGAGASVAAALVLQRLQEGRISLWLMLIIGSGAVLSGVLLQILNNEYYLRLFHSAHFSVSIMAIVSIIYGIHFLLSTLRVPDRLAKRMAISGAVAAVACIAISLLFLPSSNLAKYIITEKSAGSYRFLTALLLATDFDGDGYSALLVGADCDGLDRGVSPDVGTISGNCLVRRYLPHRKSEAEVAKEVAALLSMVMSAGHGASGEGLGARPPHRQGAKSPNILLISADALRADRVGHLGYGRETTPNLDALAANCVVMEQFYVHSSATRPSMLSWVMMQHPDLAVQSASKKSTIGSNALSMLEQAGYSVNLVMWMDDIMLPLRRSGVGSWTLAKDNKSAIDSVIELVDREDDKKFVWAHMRGVHHPYGGVEGQSSFGATVSDKYDDSVVAFDAELGRLLKHMEQSGMIDDYLIIVTSDHGEELGDHGSGFHGQTLYSESIHVPMVLCMPGVAQQRISALTRAIDLFPTLLDYSGIAVSDDKFEGRSWLPFIGGGATMPEMPHFSQLLPGSTNSRIAVRFDGCSLLYDLKHGSYELYNYAVDPGEKRNLASFENAECGFDRLAAFAAWFLTRTDNWSEHAGATSR